MAPRANSPYCIVFCDNDQEGHAVFGVFPTLAEAQKHLFKLYVSSFCPSMRQNLGTQLLAEARELFDNSRDSIGIADASIGKLVFGNGTYSIVQVNNDVYVNDDEDFDEDEDEDEDDNDN
jgi:hypothetical protein